MIKRVSNVIGTGMLLLQTSWLMAQDVPFQRGINLTGWFQASGARQIQFTKYTTGRILRTSKAWAAMWCACPSTCTL